MLLATSGILLRALSFASFLFPIALAQSCTNYGITGGSGCLCPPGFGGANCSQPACGGTIFDGSNRSLPSSSSGGFPNLTSSGCSCTDGWAGLGCDVCTTASACQAAYAAVSGNSSSSTSITQASGLNDTIVCNTSPTVYAAGELSCQVNVRISVLLGEVFDLSISRIQHYKLSTRCNPRSISIGHSIRRSRHCKTFLARSCPPMGHQWSTRSYSTAASNNFTASHLLARKHPRVLRIPGLVTICSVSVSRIRRSVELFPRPI